MMRSKLMKFKHAFDPLTFGYLVAKNYLQVEDNKLRLSLNMFYDRKHSWLEVPLLLLAHMSCYPRDFTKYSYIDKEKDMIYLEEDLDVSVFYERLKDWPTQYNIDKIVDLANDAEEDEMVVFEKLAEYEIAEGNFLDSINVTPCSHGKISSIRDLKPNEKGSSIH